jgi:DNA helicase-2/ATP-dependent DNA helicase PcrA
VSLNIPYKVVGGINFYARKEIKDILAYLKTIDNNHDDLAVKRIINVPRRGIGAASIAKVQDYADNMGISFFEALLRLDEIPTFGKGKSADKLRDFTTMIRMFRTKLSAKGSLEDLITDIIETTGYVKELEAEEDEETAKDRIDNIDEFITKLVTFETEKEEHGEEATLSAFLEEVALVADIDSVNGDDNKVLLMTIHSAKGLEFSQVYLAGLEDGVFPSYMTITSDDNNDIEEERRLAYVGITRAKDDLTITYAKARMIRGTTQYNAVSRFVKEIPSKLLDNKLPSSSRRWDEDDTFDGVPVYKATVNSNVGGIIGGVRPKAVVKKKETPEAYKPYISKSLAGLTKGAPSMSEGELGYGVGDRIHHIKYGDGTVLNIAKEPKDFKVTVNFDGYGNKIMYAGFAKLEKI